MQPFGTRLTSIRRELGLSQSQLAARAGVSQSDLSRIEKGERPPGLDRIRRLAAALERPELELVAGTDREPFYLSRTLTPNDLTSLHQRNQVTLSVHALIVQALYERVYNLFEAARGGPYITVDFDAEDLYLKLRDHCNTGLDTLRGAVEPTLPDLYFPEHFAILGQDDADSWEWEEERMKRSALDIVRFLHELKPNKAAHEAFAESMKLMPLNALDSQIAEMKSERERENLEWAKRVERASEVWKRKMAQSPQQVDPLP